MRNSLLSAIALATMLCFAACSDDDKTEPVADTGPNDTVTDTTQLWPCSTPGAACNAHDSCAVNPVCGQDLLCHPVAIQKCDDGLDCTENICAGQGLCDFKPIEGMCALKVREEGKYVVKCFKEGDRKPDDECYECKPDKDSLEWSPKNGGTCDDGDACTKDDYCQNGTCAGADYSDLCNDDISCTVDCDGLGGCLTDRPIKEGYCFIDETCYGDTAPNPDNCSTCDASKSQTAWSATPNTCLIDNTCYDPGDKHAGGCAECDPTVAIDKWTVKVTDKCLIDNICVDPQAQDSLQCGECDPTKDKYDWSPIAGKCKIFGICYDTGHKHPGGCAECDPTVDATAWTVTQADSCLIDNSCKTKDIENATACDSCQPDVDKYAWSTIANRCNIDGQCYTDGQIDDTNCFSCVYATSSEFWSANPALSATTTASNFDADTNLPTDWEATTIEPVGIAPRTPVLAKWQVVNGQRSYSGTNALYYGDTNAKNYDVGPSGGELTIKNLSLTAAKKVRLSFSLYLDVETSTSTDVLNVWVVKNDGSKERIWHKGLLSVANYRKWNQQIIKLDEYAGQTVNLIFEFIAYTAEKNTGEGVYIDDLAIIHGC